MTEKTRCIYEIKGAPRKEIAGSEREEKIEIFSDKDIIKANDLLKRRENKENPLSREEKTQLEELTVKRENEINRIFRYFNFETIAGLKENIPIEEQRRQYEAAEGYFKSIAELAKTPLNNYDVPEGLYNMALYLEKLKTQDKDPKRVEIIFPRIYNERQKLFEDKYKKINAAAAGGNIIREYNRENLLGKLESGDISSEDLNRLSEIINKEKLFVENKIPDHLREFVIYIPSLAKEVERFPYNFFWLKGPRRRQRRETIKMYRERIEKFESLKEKLERK